MMDLKNWRVSNMLIYTCMPNYSYYQTGAQKHSRNYNSKVTNEPGDHPTILLDALFFARTGIASLRSTMPLNPIDVQHTPRARSAIPCLPTIKGISFIVCAFQRHVETTLD